jgi:hypothetical protein
VSSVVLTLLLTHLEDVIGLLVAVLVCTWHRLSFSTVQVLWQYLCLSKSVAKVLLNEMAVVLSVTFVKVTSGVTFAEQCCQASLY